MRDNVSSGALTETSLLVLLSLYQELHGYGVKLAIEKKTGGRVKLGMGSLYGAINNMQEKGWIQENSREGNKINYLITNLGKKKVEEEEKRLEALLILIQEKVEEKDA